ncbi:thioredoxin TrxC [Novosphingobium pokkalii]|uniref:Thioredoxin n=1 Tax=Novosphingobium pokkalii TaxID=1770194 RepID=A0ABV7V4C7_9SPHN|nr:thioredoxin TrxC [Novosphingobium pokkalii]GHD03970.1 thiol reductase thioredoxin [Novosphingobium pokkalii]
MSEIVICPHCGGANRVAHERLGDAPNCGKCHQALFTRHPLPVNSASFAAHVGKGTLPVLVDFWAPWCGPCRAMAPAFEQAAGMLEPSLRLLKVDTEAEQALGAAHRIQSIPTLMLFSRGREVKRISGAMDARRIVEWARG